VNADGFAAKIMIKVDISNYFEKKFGGIVENV